VVTRAIANILTRSTNDNDFLNHVGQAINLLPQVAEQVDRTSVNNVTSFRAFVRQKTCACPWPWGTG
jgi:hypothetical protein